jgi:hypothetical protein
VFVFCIVNHDSSKHVGRNDVYKPLTTYLCVCVHLLCSVILDLLLCVCNNFILFYFIFINNLFFMLARRFCFSFVGRNF